MVKIVIILCMAMMLPESVLADGSYFLGTRTGLNLTGQVFSEGRYKEQNLFIVIGTEPTTDALRTISGWKSRTTYLQDLNNGLDTFGEQFLKSASSLPENATALWNSSTDLFLDPVHEFSDFNLITPVTVIGKTVVNTIRIGWNGAMIVVEPVARFGYGTVALLGAPFLKPVTYTGVALIYTGTAAYGYGSSAVAGAVMAGATGTVLTLDVATTPAVALYESFQPDAVTSAEPAAEVDSNSLPVQ